MTNVPSIDSVASVVWDVHEKSDETVPGLSPLLGETKIGDTLTITFDRNTRVLKERRLEYVVIARVKDIHNYVADHEAVLPDSLLLVQSSIDSCVQAGIDQNVSDISYEICAGGGIEYVVAIDTIAVDSNEHFHGGDTLAIPYRTEVPAGRYKVEVRSLGASNTRMKTKDVASGDTVINRQDKTIKLFVSHEGSSETGSGDRTDGLKYQIRFLRSGDDSVFGRFRIEQDTVNRAREEYNVFNMTVARDSFSTVDAALHVGTTRSLYPRTVWMDNGISGLHTTISASYPNVAYSSTWRSPYFAKTFGSGLTGKHALGKAVDADPAGNNQDAQAFHDQWSTMSSIGSRCLLERQADILRNSDFVGGGHPAYNNGGWRLLPEGDPYFDRDTVRHYNYVPPGATLEWGYSQATHYHNEER